METLKTALFFGVAIKSLVEYIFTWFVNGKLQKKQLVSFILGEIIAFSFNVDLFSAIGLISRVPYISTFISGLVLSGGSNLIYDIFNPENKTIITKEEETLKEYHDKEVG